MTQIQLGLSVGVWLFLVQSIALAQEGQTKKFALQDQLTFVREQRLLIEKALLEAEQAKKTTEKQLQRLKSLQKLQNQERELTERRIRDLQRYLDELQARKEQVLRRMDQSKADLKNKVSRVIHPLLYHRDQLISGDTGAGEKRFRERVVAEVIHQQLKSIETLRADWLDAEDMEARIEQEKQQIASLMQDISEQESLIRFHRELRESLNQEKYQERLQQLEDYRRLKVSEGEIEKKIREFQEHQKMEREEDQKKLVPHVLLKPKSLPWPLRGKLIGTYGQQRDPRTGLNIFKKGIELETIREISPVACVMEGVVQFSGSIPGKGQVVIVEHPRSIYTVYAGLTEMSSQVGEKVQAGQKLGAVGSQNPLYFEIRSRNVAMDPIRWLE